MWVFVMGVQSSPDVPALLQNQPNNYACRGATVPESHAGNKIIIQITPDIPHLSAAHTFFPHEVPGLEAMKHKKDTQETIHKYLAKGY